MSAGFGFMLTGSAILPKPLIVTGKEIVLRKNYGHSDVSSLRKIP